MQKCWTGISCASVKLKVTKLFFQTLNLLPTLAGELHKHVIPCIKLINGFIPTLSIPLNSSWWVDTERLLYYARVLLEMGQLSPFLPILSLSSWHQRVSCTPKYSNPNLQLVVTNAFFPHFHTPLKTSGWVVHQVFYFITLVCNWKWTIFYFPPF